MTSCQYIATKYYCLPFYLKKNFTSVLPCKIVLQILWKNDKAKFTWVIICFYLENSTGVFCEQLSSSKKTCVWKTKKTYLYQFMYVCSFKKGIFLKITNLYRPTQPLNGREVVYADLELDCKHENDWRWDHDCDIKYRLGLLFSNFLLGF